MQVKNTIFSQLIKLFPRHEFDRIVNKYNGDKNVRTLSCWNQFVALLFAQFTNRKSLRDLEASFNSHSNRLYHLGCNQIRKSSLAEANNKRSSDIYEEVFNRILSITNVNVNHQEMLHLIDSTQVILNKNFKWAQGQTKNGIKIHVVYDETSAKPTYFNISDIRKNDISAAKELKLMQGTTYVFDRGYYDFQWWSEIDNNNSRFVTRLKGNSPTTTIKERKVIANEEFDIISDCESRLNARLAKTRKNPYDRAVRVIKVKLRGYSNKEPITIVSNDLKSSAIKLCELYKKRWQIELFFKWIKQNLKIKTFLGTSLNAVKTQVVVAMIAYLVGQYALKLSQAEISLQRFYQMIQTNLMEYKYLQNLFCPPPPSTPVNIYPQLSLAL